MTITKRLLIAFGLALIVAVAIGTIGFQGITTNIKMTDALIHKDADFLSNALTLNIEALQHRRYEKDFFLNIGNPEKQKKYISKFDKVSNSLKGRLEHLSKASKEELDLPEEVNIAIAEALTAYNAYYGSFKDLSKTVLNDDTITPQQGNKMMKPFKEKIYTFEKSVNTIVDASKAHLDTRVEEAKTEGGTLKNEILIFFIVGLLVLGVMAYLTIKRIRHGLSTISDQMREISTGDGDLTRRIEIKNNDEIGQLSTLFNAFLDSLQQMIKRIGKNASTLNSSSTDLSSISSKLSDGATQSMKQAGNTWHSFHHNRQHHIATTVRPKTITPVYEFT